MRVFLAILLLVSAAAADVVVTATEVIKCSVVEADTNHVRLRLEQGSIRVLATGDVREIRITDSARVADLAARLPQTRVALDSQQAVQASEFRPPETELGLQDGTRDGRNDAWGPLWGGVACLMTPVGCVGGVYAAALTAVLMEPSGSWEPVLVVGGVAGTLLGATSIAIARSFPAQPPASRLMGKSSEYASAYAKAYENSCRGTRGSNAAAGWALSSVSILVYYLALRTQSTW